MMDELAPLILLSPLLVAVAYCDLRYMRIPNILSLIAVLIFALSLLVSIPDDLPWRLVAAGIMFSVGFLGFSLRILGGGDVKILAALVLFIPTSSLIIFANVLSVSLLIGVTGIVMLRKFSVGQASSFKSLATSTGFPMGISISLAGLVFPFAVLWLGTWI